MRLRRSHPPWAVLRAKLSSEPTPHRLALRGSAQPRRRRLAGRGFVPNLATTRQIAPHGARSTEISGEGGIRTLDGRNRPYRFSRPAHSTALPPLRCRRDEKLEDGLPSFAPRVKKPSQQV